MKPPDSDAALRSSNDRGQRQHSANDAGKHNNAAALLGSRGMVFEQASDTLPCPASRATPRAGLARV